MNLYFVKAGYVLHESYVIAKTISEAEKLYIATYPENKLRSIAVVSINIIMDLPS